MNIVVTDGYALNPGDLDWSSISSLGNLRVYDRTHPSELLERCKDADIILSNKTPLSGECLRLLPKLQMISVLATGYNIIDTNTAKELEIVVCNAPAYGADSVAQHVIALLLEMTNQVGRHAAATANGEWQKSPDWCFTVAPIKELAGKTLGIVGLGNIGEQVARIASALRMQICYAGPNDKKSSIATYCSMEDLFAKSDVVSLHCPLTPENEKFVNQHLLSRMKKSAILINTARGQLIHEVDLADALNKGVIKGAALDVLSKEPPDDTNPLFTAKNCIITPHVAWISLEARQRMMQITAGNIRAFQEGNPRSRVV